MPTTTANIELRDDFADTMRRRGLTTYTDMATQFGMSESTISRLLKLEMRPGERFITAVLTTCGDDGPARFEDYFHIA